MISVLFHGIVETLNWPHVGLTPEDQWNCLPCFGTPSSYQNRFQIVFDWTINELRYVPMMDLICFFDQKPWSHTRYFPSMNPWRYLKVSGLAIWSQCCDQEGHSTEPSSQSEEKTKVVGWASLIKFAGSTPSKPLGQLSICPNWRCVHFTFGCEPTDLWL